MVADRLVAVLGVGVLADPDAPAVAADDLGLTRGDGCFEATRVVVDGLGGRRIDHLDAHLDRMERSAGALGIEFDRASWRALIAHSVDEWRHPGEAIVKWMLTRGREAGGPPTGVLTITPLDPTTIRQRDRLRISTISIGRTATAYAELPWMLGGVKTLSYATNMAAGREARRRGVDDVLFVSTDGYALEAPRSALIWRLGEQLVTTTTEGTGILRSITQAAVFEAAAADGVEVSFALIPTEELDATDGVWLASSGRLVAPIVELDGRPMPFDDDWTKRLVAWAER